MIENAPIDTHAVDPHSLHINPRRPVTIIRRRNIPGLVLLNISFGTLHVTFRNWLCRVYVVAVPEAVIHVDGLPGFLRSYFHPEMNPTGLVGPRDGCRFDF